MSEACRHCRHERDAHPEGDVCMKLCACQQYEAAKLTDVDRERAIYFMLKYGGSFVHALAVAYGRADPENRRRIEAAFPEYFEEYATKFGAAPSEAEGR